MRDPRRGRPAIEVIPRAYYPRLLGERGEVGDPVSRPKALEAIGKDIRASGLQRPEDLRMIHADEKLRAVAGIEFITMYALEPLIRPHLETIV